jgi:hypothetical protein
MTDVEMQERLASLGKEELQAIVGWLLDILFFENQTINPDKSWSPDTLNDIALLLETWQLHPGAMSECGA